jgi:hypothetical protein
VLIADSANSCDARVTTTDVVVAGSFAGAEAVAITVVNVRSHVH